MTSPSHVAHTRDTAHTLDTDTAQDIARRLAAARQATAAALKGAVVVDIRAADALFTQVMADALVEISLVHGSATEADLQDLGFTVAEISAHAVEAKRRAAEAATRIAA